MRKTRQDRKSVVECIESGSFFGFTPEGGDEGQNEVVLFRGEAERSLKESILDVPKRSYCPDVLSEDGTFSPKARRQVLELLKDWWNRFDTDFHIKAVHAKGSLLSKRYTDDSDLDVTVYTDLTDEQFDDLYNFIPKGVHLDGTEHEIDLYVLKDGETTDESGQDNIYDLFEDRWIKRTEDYANEIPMGYLVQVCRFFIDGCTLALNDYGNDKVLASYYLTLSPETDDISEGELKDILKDKAVDLKADLDALKMADHMIGSFRKEAYGAEPNIFCLSIDILSDNVHNSINEQMSKLIDKFGIRGKIRDSIEECRGIIASLENQ